MHRLTLREPQGLWQMLNQKDIGPTSIVLGEVSSLES